MRATEPKLAKTSQNMAHRPSLVISKARSVSFLALTSKGRCLRRLLDSDKYFSLNFNFALKCQLGSCTTQFAFSPSQIVLYANSNQLSLILAAQDMCTHLPNLYIRHNKSTLDDLDTLKIESQ